MLTNLVNDLNVKENDEYTELIEMISCEKVGKKILKKTKERYIRYLENIEIWSIAHPTKNDCRICFKHVKDHIEIFLNLYEIKDSLNQQVKLMEYIDYELYKASK